MRLHLHLHLLALLALLHPGGTAAQSDPVEVIFLDVGQGDAVVVRAPEGQTALIDAGPGVDLTGPLAALGIDSLALVVASHPHADHIGGMWQLLQSMPVRYYMDNGQPYTTSTYLTVMRTLRSRPDVTYLEAVPRTLTLGSATVRVLRLPQRPSSNPNDHSVGLVIEHGDFRAFLSGDSERPQLLHFVRSGAVPDITLLKAPHHGSDDAVSETFLSVARPEVVVISAGYGNGYGHPSAAALTTYSRYAAEVYRTDLHSQVMVRGFADGTYEVELGATLVAEGPTGSPVPAPAPEGPSMPDPSTISASISISVFADAPGNDHRNTNGEYATVSNGSDHDIDLSGWTLCDAARHCFSFPATASVPAGGAIVLYTGRGMIDGSTYFMGSGSAVWNNDGDTATLYDRSGRVVTSHVY